MRVEGVQPDAILTPDSAAISRADLQRFVIKLRERGVSLSCNTRLRALDAFCRWLHEQGETPTRVKLPPQRLEKRIIRMHDDAALCTVLTTVQDLRPLATNC